MAMRPLKACPVPGCPNRVTRGRCEQHTRQSQRLASSHQASRHERGYDNRWAAYARSFLAANPNCRDIYAVHGQFGKFADLVDHIIPASVAPELFWEPSNHQSLCTTCHRRKTGEDARKYPKAASE